MSGTVVISKRVDTPLTLAQKKTVTQSTKIHFALFVMRTSLPFLSAWLGPVARQHYTEEASELVKHEQTDERVPKQGFLLGRAFYVLERGAKQEKDIEAQIHDRRL